MASTSPSSKSHGLSMKLSWVAAEVNLMSPGTPSFALMTVWTFMPPFFFPIFGSLPTPLKTRLENSVTVVESMILSRPSHPGSPLRRLSGKSRLLCALSRLK